MPQSAPSTAPKPPIYLLDTMAFIFRAYHAMARMRPMTTRTGVPTAATYVFVNMINKLRQDFKPDYLAAVYDVGAPLLRHETAAQLTDVKKFNIKTQQFEATEYAGYKANRAETPPDLIQQQPYIRRALEAFRIPIVYSEGYEADDVIGTLAAHFAKLGHHVYVVSPDKDMMQLVTESVSILNPTKDNLVLTPAKVEEVLGVPPARVIDVMALRGDSIDNIPGAPGIGDKGSVELIQTFGSVEAAMDAAIATPDLIKRKVYRESLANNRDNILLSKELVTIHCSVPIEPNLEAMHTQPVDNAACRALFTELEFTSLLRDLAPDLTAAATAYNLKPTPEEVAALLAEACQPLDPQPATRNPQPDADPLFRGLAIALAAATAAEESADPEATPDEAPEPPPAETMSLFGPASDVATDVSSRPEAQRSGDGAERPASGTSDNLDLAIGLAVTPTQAITASLTDPAIREALTDPKLPKLVHDLKAILRALEPSGIMLAGPITDVMLESYLLNPTHASHTLPDIAARTTSIALKHQPTKDNPSDPKRLPEAAAAIARLATTLNHQLTETHTAPTIATDDPSLGGAVTPAMLFADKTTTPSPSSSAPTTEVSSRPKRSAVERAAFGATTDLPPLNEHSTLTEVYDHLDLPLVPVLLRMEQTGVRIDPDLLRAMSSRLAVTIDDLAEKIYALSGNRFNINSPKQLGDVLFNKMGLPQPIKYGKGKAISTAQDVLEDLALKTEVPGHEVAALVLEHRQLQKLKGTYLDALPLLADANGRIHSTFNQVGTATGRLSSVNPNLQNIPIRTATGREIRAAFIAAPGNLLMSADYSQIELRLMAHFSQDPLLLDAYRTGKDIHTLTASEVFGIPVAELDKETRARAKAVNFGIVYGISPFGLAAQLNIDQKTAKAYIERYFERYAGVAHFIETTLEQVRRDQFVKTAFGRIRPIPDIGSRNPNQRGFAERTAINTPLQGTAADLIKLAMLRIDAAMRQRNLKSQMTLQVHDELLFDVLPSEAEEMQQLVKTEMESAAIFTVPIVSEVGLGDNWRDIK
ncbi:DNA polymerase I [Granulicella sp. 5B5]|uniref:DNA polymerase I n=1 Tax=Granulicella sp. 5B5 TaxID=1617967 RepID=UPI0015F47967|nr:DNA polymerase I [Granulicella sp. 5B5]QMV19214.1 DNA polymerase I [Granulicella sp. 5B5]